MNKTVVTSVGIVTFGIVVISFFVYLYYSKTDVKTETRDRLTVCMQMAMQESRESGHPIEISKAREACS